MQRLHCINLGVIHDSYNNVELASGSDNVHVYIDRKYFDYREIRTSTDDKEQVDYGRV